MKRLVEADDRSLIVWCRYVYGVVTGVGLILAAKLTASGVCFLLGKVCCNSPSWKSVVSSRVRMQSTLSSSSPRVLYRRPRPLFSRRRFPPVYFRRLGQLHAQEERDLQKRQGAVWQERLHVGARLALVARSLLSLQLRRFGESHVTGSDSYGAGIMRVERGC